MARILERSLIEERLNELKLKGLNWEYISPEYLLIHEEHNFVFKNPLGKEITFGFNEIFHWLYVEDYIGCGHNCELCLTPIC